MRRRTVLHDESQSWGTLGNPQIDALQNISERFSSMFLTQTLSTFSELNSMQILDSWRHNRNPRDCFFTSSCENVSIDMFFLPQLH